MVYIKAANEPIKAEHKDWFGKVQDYFNNLEDDIDSLVIIETDSAIEADPEEFAKRLHKFLLN